MTPTPSTPPSDNCDHTFIDSDHCLKCGWVPPNETPTPKTVAYEQELVRCAGFRINELESKNQQLKEEVKDGHKALASVTTQMFSARKENTEFQTTILGLRKALREQQVFNPMDSPQYRMVIKALSTSPADFAKDYCKRSVLEKLEIAASRAAMILPPHFGNPDKTSWELDEALAAARKELEQTKPM